jgi:hypothetical protein
VSVRGGDGANVEGNSQNTRGRVIGTDERPTSTLPRDRREKELGALSAMVQDAMPRGRSRGQVELRAPSR